MTFWEYEILQGQYLSTFKMRYQFDFTRDMSWNSLSLSLHFWSPHIFLYSRCSNISLYNLEHINPQRSFKGFFKKQQTFVRFVSHTTLVHTWYIHTWYIRGFFETIPNACSMPLRQITLDLDRIRIWKWMTHTFWAKLGPWPHKDCFWLL